MASATELLVAEEVRQLQDVAEGEGWSVTILSPLSFVVGFIARDGTPMWVRCDADEYKRLPPTWRWCDQLGQNVGGGKFTPNGGSQFFHQSGNICAPWNRDAYSSINPSGPHGDWNIGNWLENSYTGQARSLAAMAMRLGLELRLRFDHLREVRE